MSKERYVLTAIRNKQYDVILDFHDTISDQHSYYTTSLRYLGKANWYSKADDFRKLGQGELSDWIPQELPQRTLSDYKERIMERRKLK